MYVLEEIVAGARMHLTANGYSKSTISHYETVWGRLSQWCVANAPDGYDRGVERRYLKETGLTSSRLTKQQRFAQRAVERRYLKETGLTSSRLTKQQRFARRAVERLIEIAEAGAPSKPVPVRKYHVPAGLMPAYRLYKAELSCRGLKAVTVDGYLSTVRHFLFACGASKPEELSPLSLTAFSSSMSGQSPQTKAGKLYVVRDLARTLADHGMCDPSVAASMPLIPGHKHASVPSAYTAGEVSALLGAEPTGRCPLRTRAMLLLASVLGMRVGDMRALRTDDVDWNLPLFTGKFQSTYTFCPAS